LPLSMELQFPFPSFSSFFPPLSLFTSISGPAPSPLSSIYTRLDAVHSPFPSLYLSTPLQPPFFPFTSFQISLNMMPASISKLALMVTLIASLVSAHMELLYPPRKSRILSNFTSFSIASVLRIPRCDT